MMVAFIDAWLEIFSLFSNISSHFFSFFRASLYFLPLLHLHQQRAGVGGHCISASTSAPASDIQVMIIFLSFIPHLPLSLCQNHCHECLESLVFFSCFLGVGAYCDSTLITHFLSGC